MTTQLALTENVQQSTLPTDSIFFRSKVPRQLKSKKKSTPSANQAYNADDPPCRARQETNRTDAWWRKKRPAAADAFLRKLVEVVELLLQLANTRHHYDAKKFEGRVRRVLLERSERHLFYGQLGDELVILCIWGVRRRRGPKI